MKEILYYLIVGSDVTRTVIYSLSTVGLLLWMLDKLLSRKHSRTLLIVCLVLKALSWYPTELYYYLHPELNAVADMWLLIFSSWKNLIITGVFLWTYSGNEGKAGIADVICETMVVLFTFPVIFILNFIEGRPSLTTIEYPFEILDMLMPFLLWILWRAVRKPALFLAARYRAWRPKHPGLLWSLFLAYAVTSNFAGTAAEINNSRLNRLILEHQLWGAAAMILLMYWIMCQEKRTRLQHEYLLRQAALLGAYDRVIDKNRDTASEVQNQIREQVDEIRKKAQCEEQMGSVQIRTYLEQLQQEAERLQVKGVYCGNYLIDAVLCMQGETIEQRGYRPDFVCYNVPVKMEDQALVPQILGLLCEEWLDQHEKGKKSDERRNTGADEAGICRLRITGAGGQLLITTNIVGHWSRGGKAIMKDLLAEREGMLLEGKDKTDQGYMVILPLLRSETDISSDRVEKI